MNGYRTIFARLLNFLFILNVVTTTKILPMDSQSSGSLNISPVQLRVKDIAKLQPAVIDKSLLAAVNSVKPLRNLKNSDANYLPLCYSILKTMSSFEYLNKNSLLRAANELNAFLYILKKDDHIRLYCMNPEHETFRKKLSDLLINTANTALALFQSKQRGKNKDGVDFSTKIKSIEDEVVNLSNYCRTVLGEYDIQLSNNINKNYEPLADFISKVRAYKNFQETVPSVETAPSRKNISGLSYASVASKNALKQQEQQTKLKELLESARLAEANFSTSKPMLKKALGEHQTKSHLLRNSLICKPMNFCRLDELVVINSFFDLLDCKSNKPLSLLVNRALREIAPLHQLKLRMILQLYVGESCIEETAQSAKGRIWEIAVALFLHDRALLKDMGRDISEAGQKFAREFDLSFADPEILSDCKALDWNYWYPKGVLTNPSANKKVQQVLDQVRIARSRQQEYVIISKYDIPPDHQKWLSREGVFFIDFSNRSLKIKPSSQPIVLNFEELYKEPYYFEF